MMMSMHAAYHSVAHHIHHDEPDGSHEHAYREEHYMIDAGERVQQEDRRVEDGARGQIGFPVHSKYRNRIAQKPEG